MEKKYPGTYGEYYNKDLRRFVEKNAPKLRLVLLVH